MEKGTYHRSRKRSVHRAKDLEVEGFLLQSNYATAT